MPPGTSLEFRDADDSFLLTTVKDEKEIKIRIDLRILPKEVSDTKPVGSARESPNMEPHLPPPIGRIEFSLNPFKMLVSLHFWSCLLGGNFISDDLLTALFLFSTFLGSNGRPRIPRQALCDHLLAHLLRSVHLYVAHAGFELLVHYRHEDVGHLVRRQQRPERVSHLRMRLLLVHFHTAEGGSDPS